MNLDDNRKIGIAGMLSGPINEQFAYRFTAERTAGDGFVSYPSYAGMPRLDERQDDEYWQLRGKLLWQPRDDDGLRVLLSHSSAYDSPAYDDVDGPSAGVGFFDRTWWGAQSEAVFVEARSTRNRSTALDIARRTPPDNLPSYTVLNLRAGYQWGAYRLSAYVDNMTDEEYFLYRFNDPEFQVATVGRPRTIGLLFDARF